MVLGQCAEPGRQVHARPGDRWWLCVLGPQELLLRRERLRHAARFGVRCKRPPADRRRAHAARRHRGAGRLGQHGPAPDRQRQRVVRQRSRRRERAAARPRPALDAVRLPAPAAGAADPGEYLPRAGRRRARRGEVFHAAPRPSLAVLDSLVRERRSIRAHALRRLLARAAGRSPAARPGGRSLRPGVAAWHFARRARARPGGCGGRCCQGREHAREP
ncbi:hypothetical protein D3C87_1392720 [compost metagenome]